MSANTKGLGAGLAEAIGQARAVAKASKNKFHNYEYTSADDLINECRTALSGAGLSLVPVKWQFEPMQLSHGFNGDKVIGRVHVTHRLSHASGECSLPES